MHWLLAVWKNNTTGPETVSQWSINYLKTTALWDWVALEWNVPNEGNENMDISGVWTLMRAFVVGADWSPKPWHRQSRLRKMQALQLKRIRQGLSTSSCSSHGQHILLFVCFSSLTVNLAFKVNSEERNEVCFFFNTKLTVTKNGAKCLWDSYTWLASELL